MTRAAARSRRSAAAWLTALLAPALCAQDAVPVGAGSYAAGPPAHEGPKPAAMVTDRPIYLTPDASRPIPTNDWWTDLINRPFSGGLWAYPFCVQADDRGVDVTLPIGWNADGTEPARSAPVQLQAAAQGEPFVAVDARAKAWGDWTLTFRSADAAGRHIDFTIGRGLPYVWAAYGEGLTPSLTLPDGAVFFDRRGRPLTPPIAADHLGIKCGDRSFGLFAAPGTRFGMTGGQLRVQFAGDARTLVLAALARPEDLGAFTGHVNAIPQDSRYTWAYDPDGGTVTTRFTLETEPLWAGRPATLRQGFLPHHLRDTAHALPLDDASYFTPRGRLRLAAGDDFAITYPFAGTIPNFPSPALLEADDASPPLDEPRLGDYLERYVARAGETGGDTYWGGKDLVRLAKYMDLAFQSGHAAAPRLRDALRAALTDWFTYAPGEEERYFARYPNWGALVGFNESYGSAEFVDHHFHYGYFTQAAAMLAMHDPDFLDDQAFGPMVTLVARQYANWQRGDAEFPFLRTFDPWAGHSYAGGLSSPRGNNQESTSEAIQSWMGLFLLGTMLDDAGMRDCGAMGLAVESRATLEYWFDFYGDNFSPDYQHPIVGILFNSGHAYATYFSGDPAWIHGIQWIPVHPVLDFLARDRDWARGVLRGMLAERKEKEGDDSMSSMGAALGNVILGYELLFDPVSVVRQMDQLWAAGDPVARENYTGGLTYAYAHASERLGVRDHGVWFSEPTSAAYVRESALGSRTTYVLYNPRPYPQRVTAYRDGDPIGRVRVPGRTQTVTDTLTPGDDVTQPGVVACVPAADATAVPRDLSTLYAVFDQPLDASTLGGIGLEGPDAPGVEPRLVGGGEVIAMTLDGPLTADARYTVTISTGVQTARGAPALNAAWTWSFTLAPLPPLAVVSVDPPDAAERVALDLGQIVVRFNAPIDAATLKKVRLRGAGAPSLVPEIDPQDPERVVFKVSGPLQPDAGYALHLPADLAAGTERRLGEPVTVAFTTEPSPCPPNVYRDSFAGRGHTVSGGLRVDFASAVKPHGGAFSIRLVAGDTDGTLYLFHGTSDHGDGRDAVDLRAYDRIALSLRSDAEGEPLWLKIGHPVFDAAFHQVRYTQATPQFQQVKLELPEGRDQINTLLVVGVPAGATVDLDDIRFLKPGE